jgi:hypothetical protein
LKVQLSSDAVRLRQFGLEPLVMHRSRDIALSEAIIALDPATGGICVIPAPDAERVRDAFSHVFGACDPFWSECSAEAQLGELLVQVWHAVALLGMPPQALHLALAVIPQYREVIPVDSVLFSPHRR